MSEVSTAPVPEARRIVALDVLRGFAILGILVINVQSFSMIAAAYLNPAAGRELEGVNLWIWAASYLLADQKFMTIFALLYGAGIVLLTDRIEARGGRPARIHYGRTLWLLVIGLAHAWLLWFGDILVPYALCALWAYAFREAEVRTLLMTGAIVVGVASMLSLSAWLSMPHWPEAELQAALLDWSPPPAAVAAEIEAYRGGWLQQMDRRIPAAVEMQTSIFLFWSLWRAGGLMLVGMALYRLGVLSARRSDRFYARMATVGLPVGWALVATGIGRSVAADFAFRDTMFLNSQLNYWGSIPVSLGYVAVVMLACRRGWLPGLQRRLAAVGRMALTNYLAQTLACTWIFYGHGLGLFERVERPGQLVVVAVVTAAQLLWSPWWMARFRFGPAEWIWRSLTYWRVQPLRR
ncbi:MAG: DUF418 domain-containing protein [Acidobacteriota bacterium]